MEADALAGMFGGQVFSVVLDHHAVEAVAGDNIQIVGVFHINGQVEIAHMGWHSGAPGDGIFQDIAQ